MAPTDATVTTTISVTYANGIRDIAKDHDVFLLDMWGVMHDGSKPYEGVLETVKKLREAGKKLIILSNSSKRKSNSIKMLKKLGFDPEEDFEQIITSGEVSYQMLLAAASDDNIDLGHEQRWSTIDEIQDRKVFVFGSGAQDEEYCASAGWSLAPVEEASLIVARGTFTICDGTTTIDKNVDASEYETALTTALKKAAERRLPMLVTNPDKVRPDEGLPPMPGAIGDAYAAALGGDHDDVSLLIRRIGKPFAEVYELALNNNGRALDRSKACMIGDALETDVTGGSKYGITTVWVVNDGIHGPTVAEHASLEDGTKEVLQQFNSKTKTYAEGRVLTPTVIVPHFRW